jgi:uncharacterized protein YqjF (DUF2071 family)
MTALPEPAAGAAHRPWPLPAGPWVHAQRWQGLLFAHWPLPPQTLRPLLPPGLTLDTFDGRAWLGVVPFYLSGLRLRGTPAVPGLSSFPEVNVRTYVRAGGKAGVFFLSLDAGNPFAAAGGRALSLPYYFAAASIARRGGEGTVAYASRRLLPPAPGPGRPEPAVFRATYRPSGPVALAERGTLDHWLTERYCLYSVDRRERLRRLEVHHAPWPLQPATAEIAANTLAAAHGIRLPPVAARLHYAHRLDVVGWAPGLLAPGGI